MTPRVERRSRPLRVATTMLACAFLVAPGSLGQGSGLRDAVSGGARNASSRAESRPDPAPARQRLEWTTRHQSADGRWSGSEFATLCDTRSTRCRDAGGPGYDIGLTGLVAYAMLSAGYDSRGPSPYQESLLKALRYLETVQDSQGRFGDPSSPHFAWCHALATVAMRTEYAMSRDARWGGCATAAVKALCTPDAAAWPWHAASVKDEGVYATAWALLALVVPDTPIGFDREPAIKAAIRYLDRVADGATRPSLIAADSRSAANPSETRPALTVADCALAATFVARGERDFFRKDADPQRTQRTLDFLRMLDRSQLPITRADDLHAALFATKAALLATAIALQRSEHEESWRRWCENIRKATLAAQLPEGCAEGSWSPSDDWTRASGRVGSSGLSLLVVITSYNRILTFR